MLECRGKCVKDVTEIPVCIYVIAHKQFDVPTSDILYRPLMVGNGYTNIQTEFLTDRLGDSISNKNPRYNELTGLYWIWKNTNHEITGICHYRRFFTTPRGKVQNLLCKRTDKFIDQSYIQKVLRNHDVILHNKTFFKSSNEVQLYSVVRPEIMELVEQTVNNMYPEDVNVYREIMGCKYAHLLNIMIARKELIDEYCEWLFPLLYAIEKKIDEKFPGEEFPRIMGFIAERLLDVWVKKRGLKIKECFTVNTERVDWKIW